MKNHKQKNSILDNIHNINSFLKIQSYRLIDKNNIFNRLINNIEDVIYQQKYYKINVEQPVFVIGQPRSGTTLLTEIIFSSGDFSSPQYKDLPMIHSPIIWSKFSKFYYGKKKLQRPHNDLIDIDLNSPDSFDEIFFKNFMENYNDYGFREVLDNKYQNDDLEKNYIKFIKKKLYLDSKKRYLAKSNYKINRIIYLKKLFPQLKIIFVIRNPLDTIHSSVMVDQVFKENTNKNKYFNIELEKLCHYEFGYDKKLYYDIKDQSLKNLNIEDLNRSSIDFYLYQYYLYQNIIYKNLQNKDIKKNILCVSYDRLISDSLYLKKIFSFLSITKSSIIDSYKKKLVNTRNYKNKDILGHKFFSKCDDIYNKLINFCI